MSEREIENLNEIMVVIWRELEDLPEDGRAYAGGRLARMAEELLGPHMWKLLLRAQTMSA